MIAFIIELNDYNFQEIISKNELVLVDIKADWCQPCKVISPIVDEISIDFQGRIVVCKLDADSNKDIISKLSIRNIPTLLLYKNGEVVDRLVGSVTKKNISDMINMYL